MFERLIFKFDINCGGIAQLGERLNGIQEVSGSIPLISTKKQPATRPSLVAGCFNTIIADRTPLFVKWKVSFGFPKETFHFAIYALNQMYRR